MEVSVRSMGGEGEPASLPQGSVSAAAVQAREEEEEYLKGVGQSGGAARMEEDERGRGGTQSLEAGAQEPGASDASAPHPSASTPAAAGAASAPRPPASLMDPILASVLHIETVWMDMQQQWQLATQHGPIFSQSDGEC